MNDRIIAWFLYGGNWFWIDNYLTIDSVSIMIDDDGWWLILNNLWLMRMNKEWLWWLILKGFWLLRINSFLDDNKDDDFANANDGR